MLLFQRLGWFFRRYWHTYSLALTMLFIVGLLNMAIPWVIGRSVDQILATHSMDNTRHYLIILLLCGIAIYLLRYGWRRLLFGTSFHLANLFRRQFYQRLTKQGQAFYSAHSTGDLMARATNDIDAVESAAGEGILSGFDGMSTFILVVIMMFVFIDWRLATVALIPFPFMGVFFYRLSSTIHHQFRDTLDKFSTLNEQTQQAIVGVRMIKAMGREEIEKQQFDHIAEQAAHSNYHVERSEAKFDPVIQVSLGSSMLLTLLMGGWLIHQDQLTVGQLTSFSLYLSQLIWPMFAFGWLMNILQRGNAAIGRLYELLSLPDTIEDTGQLTPHGHEIAIESLTFTYPETRQPSLVDINVTLPEQRVLGIAGPTGAGKSTLLQLLMRYWEVENGVITLNDIPLRELSLHALREQFAYVPQDAFLFSTSILENIRMGKPDASDEDIYEAARLAAIHDDIVQFPEGYHTLVGERGVTLSGGQRQRVSIARALISDAAILILDDALSAVDVGTEQTIIRHLKQRESQSVIIVTHRLSAIEHANEIIVLSHGRIAERGTHQQLSQSNGWYSQMVAYQQMKQALDKDYHDEE
ncbi:ABC transporter ATP-binding protein [Vibrio zhugei]|uniref:ABC transporter ATP-binding protein n=1 Tax=Vibrio zhugei TaxID=2479546 RepID=A0ABV7C7A9_9VIBR|nr:ABC transporter transmembrane domain-containing protein [Vibrio zhugei]